MKEYLRSSERKKDVRINLIQNINSSTHEIKSNQKDYESKDTLKLKGGLVNINTDLTQIERKTSKISIIQV